jgi:D-alanyl-D-alanine carboxypeptidase (penicillin-binding protein 5/6)
LRAAVLLALLALTAVLLVHPGAPAGLRPEGRTTPPGPRPGAGAAWPAGARAALQLDGGPVTTSGAGTAVPIGSVTKVMTAYLVLTRHPLAVTDGRVASGRTLVVPSGSAADTRRRTGNGESVVPLVAGERLTQRQALEALLLPSANNVADLLAVTEGGTRAHFVAEMNDQAHALGMRHTTYADASGLDPTGTSTAADQVRLFAAAMRLPAFAALVAEPSATIPVAGRITSTDVLLGRPGFLGGKTGSTAAAGSCFVFQARVVVDGRDVLVTGAVLGQRGPDLVTAGQDAAWRLLRSLTASGTATAPATAR